MLQVPFGVLGGGVFGTKKTVERKKRWANHGSYHPCMVYIYIPTLVDVYGLNVYIGNIPYMDPMGGVVLKLSWFCSFPFFPLWLVGRCAEFIIIKQFASTCTGSVLVLISKTSRVLKNKNM